MFISTNQDELHIQETTLFAPGFNISMEHGSLSFFHFTNRLMSKVYKLNFDTKLPRVSQEMNNTIQMVPEPTGDWFLNKDHEIIIGYGFIRVYEAKPTFKEGTFCKCEESKQYQILFHNRAFCYQI